MHLVVGNCVVVRMFLLRARKIWGEKSEKTGGDARQRFGFLFGYTSKADSVLCCLEFVDVCCISVVAKQVSRWSL